MNERDSCIVAVSAGQFRLQAIQFELPPSVTSVYPIGRERVNFDPHAVSFNSVFEPAPHIQRIGGQPAQRTAFQDAENSMITGLIWSLRSIGNFLGRPDDFMFVQNKVAVRRYVEPGLSGPSLTSLSTTAKGSGQ